MPKFVCLPFSSLTYLFIHPRRLQFPNGTSHFPSLPPFFPEKARRERAKNFSSSSPSSPSFLPFFPGLAGTEFCTFFGAVNSVLCSPSLHSSLPSLALLLLLLLFSPSSLLSARERERSPLFSFLPSSIFLLEQEEPYFYLERKRCLLSFLSSLLLSFLPMRERERERLRHDAWTEGARKASERGEREGGRAPSLSPLSLSFPPNFLKQSSSR